MTEKFKKHCKRCAHHSHEYSLAAGWIHYCNLVEGRGNGKILWGDRDIIHREYIPEKNNEDCPMYLEYVVTRK